MKMKLILLTIIVGLLVATPAFAANWLEQIGITDGAIVPKACTGANKGVNACGLTEALETIVNLSKLLLALTGSAALLMFMYGGILWVISAGNQERVQKGKAAITAAGIGIVIILSSWLIVNFTILALTKGEVGGTANIFGNSRWDNEPDSSGTNCYPRDFMGPLPPGARYCN
jgi:type IV secretion system pilin